MFVCHSRHTSKAILLISVQSPHTHTHTHTHTCRVVMQYGVPSGLSPASHIVYVEMPSPSCRILNHAARVAEVSRAVIGNSTHVRQHRHEIWTRRRRRYRRLLHQSTATIVFACKCSRMGLEPTTTCPSLTCGRGVRLKIGEGEARTRRIRAATRLAHGHVGACRMRHVTAT